MKSISSHVVNLMFAAASIFGIGITYYIIFHEILHDLQRFDIFSIFLLLILLAYAINSYGFLFAFIKNSAVSYNSRKVKISKLWGKNKVIDLKDVTSVRIMHGGVYAVIKYLNSNNESVSVYVYNNPVDHASKKLLNTEGLLDSSHNWNNIFELKKMVESEAVTRPTQ